MQEFFVFLSILFFVATIVFSINPAWAKNKQTEIEPKRREILVGGIFITMICLVMVGVLAPEPAGTQKI